MIKNWVFAHSGRKISAVDLGLWVVLGVWGGGCGCWEGVKGLGGFAHGGESGKV